VSIYGSDPTDDRLVLRLGDGGDTLDAASLLDGFIRLEAHGEDGNDILLGSEGPDVLLGGEGDDVLIGNQGLDILDGGPGDNIVLQ
jgi:Ca2+-binding RTX toxin-like protein